MRFSLQSSISKKKRLAWNEKYIEIRIELKNEILKNKPLIRIEPKMVKWMNTIQKITQMDTTT